MASKPNGISPRATPNTAREEAAWSRVVSRRNRTRLSYRTLHQVYNPASPLVVRNRFNKKRLPEGAASMGYRAGAMLSRRATHRRGGLEALQPSLAVEFPNELLMLEHR